MKTLIIAALFACDVAVAGQNVSFYTVQIDTSAFEGIPGAAAFYFTESQQDFNTVEIQDFSYDGEVGELIHTSGSVSGDIVDGRNPAANSYLYFFDEHEFLSELTVPFETFGTFFSFSLRITESIPADAHLPAQLSFYLLTENGQPLFRTADPLGANSLFTLTIDGQQQGEAHAFAPAALAPTAAVDIAVPFCGNGTLDAAEECEDENLVLGDGCDFCVFGRVRNDSASGLPRGCYGQTFATEQGRTHL
ncbi:MAG TPA: hypothetical protein VD994_20150 [Prosthecobacter sp.]|nr:hypothetical protein [Prosthecobacter sp.]